MVQYRPSALAIFNALGDPTRAALVERLSHGETAAQELAAPFAMSLTAVQKHIRVLEGAGLVTTRKQGRERRCRLVGERLDEAAAWLTARRSLWNARLDSLGNLLESESEQPQERERHA